MIRHKILEWDDIELYIDAILVSMDDANYKPDHILGITRGGLVPAVMLSHELAVGMSTFKVSFYHGGFDVDNDLDLQRLLQEGKKILVVDDINDSGKTLAHIDNVIQQLAFDDVDVKFACLVDNTKSDFDYVNFRGISIEKPDDLWYVFPWEHGG